MLIIALFTTRSMCIALILQLLKNHVLKNLSNFVFLLQVKLELQRENPLSNHYNQGGARIHHSSLDYV